MRFHNLSTLLQKIHLYIQIPVISGSIKHPPYWIPAPYFCAEWSRGTNCGDTVRPLQLSHCMIATNQKPANPIYQHVLHNTVARTHISPTYGLCISASGYWQARKHASNRGFLSNANLAMKLLHLLVCSALSSAGQWSTFYIHCVHTQLKGTNTCATKKNHKPHLHQSICLNLCPSHAQTHHLYPAGT